MPLQRFRSFEEARSALVEGRRATDLVARIRRLWTLAGRLAPGGAPRGLRKFRTLQEADRHREQGIAARVHELRRVRGLP